MSLTKYNLRNCVTVLLISACLVLIGCGTTYAPRAPTNQIIQSATQEIRGSNERKKSYVSMAEAEAVGRRILNRIKPSASTLCRHLGDQVSTRCRNWRLAINDSSENNAASLGNNQIAINKGTFEYSIFEDEIAFVIAHELAHDMLNHRFEDQTNVAIGAIIGGVIGGVIAATVAEAAGIECNPQFQNCDFLDDLIEDSIYAGAEIGIESGILFYSREQETEADLMAAYLLSLSGYSLIKAREFIVNMGISDSTRIRSDFNDTHPSGVERLATFSNIIDEVQTNLSRLPR